MSAQRDIFCCQNYLEALFELWNVVVVLLILFGLAQRDTSMNQGLSCRGSKGHLLRQMTKALLNCGMLCGASNLFRLEQRDTSMNQGLSCRGSKDISAVKMTSKHFLNCGMLLWCF
ncbi:hypothetical protein AVEN_103834-1 [Araneus ventricosus]|uniref:Uncharacterized protein n=1 Tax=Araneus ventricosus TaxID=182803 RepID=A0A4Y2UIF4_ARAVE|nr:hypothetical protein AVEN_103834-1 [Araneus ventricosus]